MIKSIESRGDSNNSYSRQKKFKVKVVSWEESRHSPARLCNRNDFNMKIMHRRRFWILVIAVLRPTKYSVDMCDKIIN